MTILPPPLPEAGKIVLLSREPITNFPHQEDVMGFFA